MPIENIAIPSEANDMLNLLSAQSRLSKATVVELLISQAYHADWTVLKPLSAGSTTESELIDFPLLKRLLTEDGYSSLTSYLETKQVSTWVGLGKLGVRRLGLLSGVGDYSIKTIRSLLEEQNVILSR